MRGGDWKVRETCQAGAIVTRLHDGYPRPYVRKDNITGRFHFDSELRHAGKCSTWN